MKNLESISEKHSIVFYDGDCGFCNYWVQWILKRDKKDQFLFASLQSDLGQDFLKQRHLNLRDFDTIYLWKPKHYYLKKSDAAIQIAADLSIFYELLKLGKIIPKFIRDGLYDIIAARRKKLMKAFCTLLSDKDKKKFLN